MSVYKVLLTQSSGHGGSTGFFTSCSGGDLSFIIHILAVSAVKFPGSISLIAQLENKHTPCYQGGEECKLFALSD